MPTHSSTVSQSPQDQAKKGLPASAVAGPEALSTAQTPSTQPSHTLQVGQNAQSSDAASGPQQRPGTNVSRPQPALRHVQDANGSASPSSNSESCKDTGGQSSIGSVGPPVQRNTSSPAATQLGPAGNDDTEDPATGKPGLPLGNAQEQPACQLDPAGNGAVERAATGKLGLPLGDAPEQPGEVPPLRRKLRTPEQRKGAISWQQGPSVRDSLEPAQTDLPLFSPDPAYRITPPAAMYPSANLASDSPAGAHAVDHHF